MSEVHCMIPYYVRSSSMVVNILKECYTLDPSPVGVNFLSLQQNRDFMILLYDSLLKGLSISNVRLCGKPIPCLSLLTRFHGTPWNLGTTIHHGTLPLLAWDPGWPINPDVNMGPDSQLSCIQRAIMMLEGRGAFFLGITRCETEVS